MTRDYIAGLFDGEGCIEYNQRGTWYYLRCTIAGLYRPSIERLQEQHGGYVTHWDPKDRKKRRMWRWRVIGKDAMKFLEFISPVLREKQQQAMYCIRQGWRVRGIEHNEVLHALKKCLEFKTTADNEQTLFAFVRTDA